MTDTCSPDEPLEPTADLAQRREQERQREHVRLAAAVEMLRTCRREHKESAEKILKDYFLNDKGPKISALKKMLSDDGKLPVKDEIPQAVIDAGILASRRHCPMARAWSDLETMLFGEPDITSLKQFYGNYRSIHLSEKRFLNFEATIGPCKTCRRVLFKVESIRGPRVGFVFNLGARLYLLTVQRDHMRFAIVQSHGDAKTAPLVGILLEEERAGGGNVSAGRIALIPKGSPWYKVDDVGEQIAKLLVECNEDVGIRGILEACADLPEDPKKGLARKRER